VRIQLKLEQTHKHRHSYWNQDANGNAEYICGQGLRNVTDVPKSAKTIFVVVHEEIPEHSHWFLMHEIKGIDWYDDTFPHCLDSDFQDWLCKRWNEGFSYLVIEYEAKT